MFLTIKNTSHEQISDEKTTHHSTFKVFIKGLAICLLFIFSCLNNSFNAQITPVTPNIALPVQNSTEGTFFFTFPNNKVMMMTEDTIVALYSQIESHRLANSTYHWEYTEDITIVIFSQTIINDPNFTPINSPYDKIKIE